jgi:hypothetical protein
MAEKEVFELSDDELLQEAKKIKLSNVGDALIIGVLIGISIYSSVKNGFGLLTFLPLIYAPIAAKHRSRNTKLKDQIKQRRLEY